MPSYRTVSISELTPGSELAASIFDSQFVKLLDAGAVIDQHLLERLEALGITEVVVESAAQHVVRRPTQSLPAGVRVRPKEGIGANAAIDRCSYCGAIIALKPPMPNSKVGTWLCKTCGAVYFGSDDGGSECRGVTRSEPNTFDPSVVPVDLRVEAVAPSIPPANVQRLLRSLVPGEYAGPDRRTHKRHPVAVPVVVLPLASDFRIDGEPVQMTTANISLGGAALIHTRFIDAPHLALDFTVAGVELLQVVLKVLRVRNIGPVYEVAGQFISSLSQAPK